MSLFGSSGIRGLVGQVITPDLAMSIGAAVGSLGREVLLAKDTRTSGDMMVNALSAGITSTGANASYAGMVPTPTLARAAEAYDCGLMITASHFLNSWVCQVLECRSLLVKRIKWLNDQTCSSK